VYPKENDQFAVGIEERGPMKEPPWLEMLFCLVEGILLVFTIGFASGEWHHDGSATFCRLDFVSL